MGKTPKLKTKAPSKHSRAARRAPEPPPSDLNAPRASSPRRERPSVLAANPSGGISKRPKRGQHTRHQKLRREQGLQKADEFAEKLDIKLKKSLGQVKKVKDRSKAWEDVNNGASIAVKLNKFEALREQNNHNEEWEDVDDGDDENMNDAETTAVMKEATAGTNETIVPKPEQTPLPEIGEDEIL